MPNATSHLGAEAPTDMQRLIITILQGKVKYLSANFGQFFAVFNENR